MRALWTAASGLTAQQRKLDVISNNIANVNTVGYQSKEVSFSNLLATEHTQPVTVAAPNRQGPMNLRIGNGTYAAYLRDRLTKGSLQQTEQPLDMAITGDGLFSVQKLNAAGQPEIFYTRAGHFQMDRDGMLVNESGYRLLDQDNQPIEIPAELRGGTISIAPDGSLSVSNNGETTYITSINVTAFRTPESSLQAAGDNLYRLVNPVVDPGTRLFYELDPATLSKMGTIAQGMLEQSNVDLPQEMTDLIEVQRAFQLNSRAVQTMDQMMGMANNLRG